MSKNQTKKNADPLLDKPQSPPEEAPVVEKDLAQKTVKEGDKAESKSADKKSENNKKPGKPAKSKKDSSIVKSPSFFARFKWVLIWLIIFSAIIAAVLLTRKDLDWQVQHINDLQAKVVQLNQAQQALETRIDSQLQESEQRILARVETEIQAQINQSVQSNVNQSLALPEHQSVVTQADIDKIQQATQQQLSQLQQQLSTLGEQAAQQVQPILSSASVLAETTKEALQPTPETEQALAEIETKLQTQLAQVGNKLAELFAFKSEQQARSTQEAEQKSVEKLSLEQFQSWVIEVNTQWLLRGNIAETRSQLTALQQAVAVSQLPNIIQLASLIGQDFAYLEQYQSQKQNSLSTDALKQAIQSIHIAAASDAQPQGGEKISNDADTAPNATFDSAIEQLKQTLSGMVSIKKRDSEAEITQVESLILQDVLMQRALLLVDRIDWALVSQSNTQLQQAVQDLQSYIDQTFPQESARFTTLLSPFASHQFEVRQPLSIRGWLAKTDD